MPGTQAAPSAPVTAPAAPGPAQAPLGALPEPARPRRQAGGARGRPRPASPTPLGPGGRGQPGLGLPAARGGCGDGSGEGAPRRSLLTLVEAAAALADILFPSFPPGAGRASARLRVPRAGERNSPPPPAPHTAARINIPRPGRRRRRKRRGEAGSEGRGGERGRRRRKESGASSLTKVRCGQRPASGAPLSAPGVSPRRMAAAQSPQRPAAGRPGPAHRAPSGGGAGAGAGPRPAAPGSRRRSEPRHGTQGFGVFHKTSKRRREAWQACPAASSPCRRAAKPQRKGGSCLQPQPHCSPLSLIKFLAWSHRCYHPAVKGECMRKHPVRAGVPHAPQTLRDTGGY